jgi:hypothetical protein
MPVKRCEIDGKPGWQYGESGKCYTFDDGDDASEKTAKAKAVTQGLAIGGGKPPAEGLSETPFIDRFRLADRQVAAGDVLPMMLFPVGNWRSDKPRHEKLPLTIELADALIANFEAGVLGTEPVLDSSGRHDTSAPAAGWFKRLYVADTDDGGQALYGDVELTDVGADDLNSKRYRYNSVELGRHTDNASGEIFAPVFRSATLTNTPVLRMLPPVLEAADRIAKPLALALSEISAAEDSNDEERERLCAALRERLGSGWVIDWSDEWVVFEREPQGSDGPRTMLRIPYATIDDGYDFGPAAEVDRHVVYEPKNSAEPPRTLSDDPNDGRSSPVGDTTRKEREPMKTILEYFKLAEDATEADVRALCVKLSDERDTEKKRADGLQVKLDENDKAARKADSDRKLDEAIKTGHVLPAEKDLYVKLAEDAPETFDASIEARMAIDPIVKTDEIGDAGKPTEAAGKYANPDRKSDG